MSYNGNGIDPCRNAKTISDATRSIYNGGGNLCDDRLKDIWYRFNDGLNSQVIAEGLVGVDKCGTYATGWLTRNHPTGNDYICLTTSLHMILMIY